VGIDKLNSDIDVQRISSRTLLILILLAGVALRGGLLWKRYDQLSEDRDAYRGIARQVADGHGYTLPNTMQPTAYRPPTYTLLLAGLYWMGFDQGGVALLHLGMGAATILLTYLIGLRYGLGRYSLIAAAIVAGDPVLLAYAPLVMTETTAAFLMALLLWASALPEGQSTQSRGRLFAIGCLFGLAALCRPTIWAFGGLIALWWLGRRLMRREVAPAIPVLVGALLVAAPWVGRNLLVFGKPILATTHGGYTLLLGNNPVYYQEVARGGWTAVWSGESLDRWQKKIENEMATRTPPVRAETERDRWMFSRAKENIAADPTGFFRAVILRLGRGLWGVVPLNSQGAVLKWGTAVFYGIVFLGMLVGLITLKTSELRRWTPIILLLVSFTVVHTLFWANVRMRAPLTPAIALLAARGCGLLGRRGGVRLKSESA